MTTIAKKEAILKWIAKIDDADIINQLFSYKEIKQKPFEEAIKDAISANEVKAATTAYIKTLDLKK